MKSIVLCFSLLSQHTLSVRAPGVAYYYWAVNACVRSHEMIQYERSRAYMQNAAAGHDPASRAGAACVISLPTM